MLVFLASVAEILEILLDQFFERRITIHCQTKSFVVGIVLEFLQYVVGITFDRSASGALYATTVRACVFTMPLLTAFVECSIANYFSTKASVVSDAIATACSL